MTYLPQSFFINNRQNLKQRSDAKLIVIAGNGLMQRSGSVNYEFQQDSNFYYLTGLDEPNMVLAINCNTGEEILVRGPQTEVGEIFDGSASQASLTARSGVQQVLSHDDGWELLEKWINSHKDVHIIEPPDKFIPSYSMYTNPARAVLKRRIKKLDGNTHDIFPDLMEMRVIKQEPELKALKKAIQVTGLAIEETYSKISKYDYEYELEADITAAFMRSNRSFVGYGSIIASGLNACTIHYMENKAKIDKSKVLLIDVGAQIEHYSADISRVFLPKNDNRAKEIHSAILELQKIAYGIIKPGVKFIDYERTMEGHYADKLQQLGVIDNKLSKTIRKFMPHATSHFLGLDVHDVGDYRQEFRPGMVITVEPGFYIKQDSIAVRLEDNILITEDGNKNLSKQIPNEMYIK